nr:dihydroorotate dehydrogenase electron transfer subunit [Muribaculaceae bacterium]
MKKALCDLTVTENRSLGPRFSLLTFRGSIPDEILPGQFAQVRIDTSKPTFLRRPISICDADPANGTLRLLVRRAGAGTEALCEVREGAVVNMLLPLGRTFSAPDKKDARILLVGGGVGVAPMIFYGKCLKTNGYQPEF